ncbi:YqaJ viral recombinase family protein [Ottowia sp. VDI28]|uniref:YqaJ viral recombinase family protein n=1 Tax=Ottowia sp. VDI28 TaxID=3133968 RepID=UPI003C2C6141
MNIQNRITHSVQQGSPEWALLRARYFTASEAPAMMGVSKYSSRQDLLRQKATGITEEVGGAKQALFDRGHAAESAARPLAESIVGDELFPVTLTADVDGLSLLASMDGLTMTDELSWETKLWNEKLAADVEKETLADHYTVQMDQQLLVSGASRCLFTCSDGTPERTVSCWYETTPEKIERLLAGWRQFAEDLANYTPDAPKADPVVPAPQETLPSVSVQMNGQLAIVSNLPSFGQALKSFIVRIPANPSTDQEFADTEAACKRLKRAEEELESAEEHALAQMADVNAMRQLVKEFRELARTTRLQREKLVALRKEQIRGELVAAGQNALAAHVVSLNKRLGKNYMPNVQADFGGVIKGKRTVDSLKDAINTELARAKIAANEIADRIQVNLETLRTLAADHVFLFADTASIVLKAPDDLEALVKSRIAEHKAKEEAKLEAERERIRKEEQEKVRAAQQDEDETIEAIWRHARRIEGNRVGYVQKAIGYFESGPGKFADDPRPRVAAAVAEARAEMQVKLKEAQAHEDAERAQWQAEEAERKRREALLQNEKSAQADIEQAVQQGELAAPLAQDIRAIQDDLTAAPVSREAISNAQRTAAAAPGAPEGQPTLRIGHIADRLGWSMTAEQMRTLGIEPAAKERGSVLYHESQFPTLCDAIARRALEAKAAHSQHATA